MNHQTLRLQSAPAIQTVQLYRPEADNAINSTLIQELSACLSAVEQSDNIKVVVLEGLPHVFCSGMDFQEYIKTDLAEKRWATETFTVFKQLAESSKITVAKVQGKVNAGGIGLVAACDLVVADSESSFGLSELLFGLLPAMVLPFLLRRIGYQRAKLLALSTQTIGAAEAQRWGLVDAYGADVETLLRPYLQRWRRLSPSAIQQLKKYMNQLQPIDVGTQTLALTTIGEIMANPEIKVGIRHYVEEGGLPWSRT